MSSPYMVGERLCILFGLDPNKTKSITIHAEVGELPTVRVEQWLDDLSGITAQEFTLTPITDAVDDVDGVPTDE